MKENKFIAELERKTAEQLNLAKTELIPEWAKGVGDWLATNPWRVLMPLSGFGYVGMRIVGGIEFREFILGLFGGFK